MTHAALNLVLTFGVLTFVFFAGGVLAGLPPKDEKVFKFCGNAITWTFWLLLASVILWIWVRP